MLAIQRILFPTDGGPEADRAFAHAAFLASRLGASLDGLRVLAPYEEETASPRTYAVPPGVEWTDIVDRSASIADAIVRASREADLVVMSTGGLAGRVTLGATTERVIHEADCPVLAVGPTPIQPGPRACTGSWCRSTFQSLRPFRWPSPTRWRSSTGPESTCSTPSTCPAFRPCTESGCGWPMADRISRLG